MAIKNIKVVIAPPALDALSPAVVFVSSAAQNDYIRIPRRVPFADVVAPNGFFRHGVVQNGSGNVSTAVSTDEFPGSATTNTEGGLGYQLPHPEKLVLLIKKGATTAERITILGSPEYRIPDLVIDVGPASDGTVGAIYEFSLANLGLYIGSTSSGANEPGLMIKSNTTTLGIALIARAA